MARSQGSGIAAAVLATTAFSSGFILVKMTPLPSPAIAFWRLVVGSGVLALVALLLRVPWPRLTKAVVGAGLAFGVHQLLFIRATQTTSIAIVTLVLALQPLLVILLSRPLLGEPVSRGLVVSASVGVAGVAMVIVENLDHVSRSFEGDLLAGANLFAFTAYFLLARRARAEGAATLTFTAAFLAVALVVVAPVALLGGVAADAVPSLPVMAMIVTLALVPGNGHLLLNWAHPRISAAVGSLILAAVPALASVWAHLVFDEPYGWVHAAGTLLVVLAIQGARQAEEAPPPAAEV